MDINQINDPLFLKNLTLKQLDEVAEEIRAFLIANLSKTGGHLSSNLGVVELTMALHYVFNSPTDKIFFDVGHQSYVHKILTGRANQFSTLRKYHGLSGFQKRSESIHDTWEAGHSSTALSGAVGMAVSRDLNKQNYSVIPVIGDAAMVGGMSLEALNHLGSLDTKVIIVLNDNQMSISKNVGGVNKFLSELRTSMAYNKAKQEYKEHIEKSVIGKRIYKATKSMKEYVKARVIQDSIFTEFGVDYLGPIDGHDFKDLIRALKKAQNLEKSVVVHVLTKKGKGYHFSEEDTGGVWHGIGPFDIQTGRCLLSTPEGMISWSQMISDTVGRIMENDKDVVAITPAMIPGSKLENVFKTYPDRSFDVGIAEAHAVTFAAGLSISGKKPFLSVYSSFLQRAYDQINHDLARMNLPVVIGIDRAGLVGEDGETHHGVFDIGFLNPIPNLTIFSPKDEIEAQDFLHTTFKNLDGPVMIRYPRGYCLNKVIDHPQPIEKGTWTYLEYNPNHIGTVISYGPDVEMIYQMVKRNHLKLNVVNARFIKPIDQKMLDEIASFNHKVLIYETSQKIGGLGSIIMAYYTSCHTPVFIHSLGLEDKYIVQGSVNELLAQEHLDEDSLEKEMKEYFNV